MHSPQKLHATASPAKIMSTKGSEFPPIRARSPKKEVSRGGARTSPSKRHYDNGNKRVGLPRVGSTKVSYATNGDPTALPHVLESGEELEVLKCILVREGYLQRLGHASARNKVSGAHLSETIDVLDLLRVATIDVVEAIVAWRIKQQRQISGPAVFTWNSINYLLKLASDLDFLDKHQGLVQWLGFTLMRNPFILPVNLTTRSQLDQSDSVTHALPSRHDDTRLQFVQVGGKRVTVDPDLEATSALRAAQAAALTERKRAKHPYETRVLNDEELVPLARTGSRTASALASDRPGSRAAANVELPSQIGELDVARIHTGERIVLHEEATYGRYTRDSHGHVVPESEAVRRRNMVEMSGDAYAQVVGEKDDWKNKDEEETSEQISYMGDRHQEQNSKRSGLPPEAHAKKRAGMLGPISKPQQRKPVRTAPRDRSRGAQYEESLQRERRANLQLGVLIDRVREEIERKEMDLAYFESFPGVQLYGHELHDFRRKTRAEVVLLRRDVTEKSYVYESRTANLNRKEEIIYVFKENHKSAVETERSDRLEKKRKASTVEYSGGKTNQEPERARPQAEEKLAIQLSADAPAQGSNTLKPDTQISTTTAPLVHNMCATLIQKIARGKLARAAFDVLKIEYYVGSKYIQAVVRGFLARRRVAKLYWHHTASLCLQRFARGMLARRLVARKRHARRLELAALRIQRIYRGHGGRKRMTRVRRLFAGRAQLQCSVDELTLSDLKELAEACWNMVAVPTINGIQTTRPRPLPSLVLGLVRVLMVFTSDRDEDVDIEHARWKEAAHFLRCSSRLQRRLSKVAGIAATGERSVRRSLLGTALLHLYSRDTDFNEHTFATLSTGWRAATVLYRWVTAVDAVCQSQGDAVRTLRPFLFAESTDAIEAMHERIEEEETTIRERAMERRFVPQNLVASAKARTRGMLVVVAFDVPTTARYTIISNVREALPGLLIVLNRRQGAETPTRVPKVQKHQLEILGADYTSVRDALAMGHSVILDCDIGLTDPIHRQFIGAITALKASIKPSPQCLLVRGSLGNRSILDSGEFATRAMADAKVKRVFEQNADWLHHLHKPQSADEMIRTSIMATSPSAAFVLVMETVVILLTPTKRYDAPQPHTSGVSWKLATRLLATPSFLLGKLANTNYSSISSHNLGTLHAYLQHTEWPTPTLAHGTSSGLLFALASWVSSMITCAQLALDRHGLATIPTRSAPIAGLFDNVVVYDNVLSNFGDVTASNDLLEAALADVRVYRNVHTLNGRRCVLSVYHDCQRLFFCAYDPLTSWRWQRMVPEEEVDLLLAPNSIERGEETGGKRRPPATQAEMYDQLVRLCLLQSIEGSTMKKREGATSVWRPETQQLVVRQPALRLFRRVVRLNGHRTTVTLAELSRGRLQVDVAVHDRSLALRRIVSLEEILERLSHRAARTVFIPPEQIPSLILERLYLVRQCQSSVVCANRGDLQVGVRTTESALGRVVLRKAIRSRWLSATSDGRTNLWVLTVLQHHKDERFRVEIYQPQSSDRFSHTISKREFQDLRLADLCQRPSGACAPSLLRSIVQLFQFKTILPEEEEGGEIPARITSCTLRHHMLARFPLAIPFVTSPHHTVEKRRVHRVYIQVETNADTPLQEKVRLRVCFPECCEEQTIEWEQEEVDSFFFSSSDASWATAERAERKRLAYDLAKNVVRWDSSTQRVIAELPCGNYEASLCVRETGVQKAAAPKVSPLPSTPSDSAARSSHGLVPTTVSCIQLLDSETPTRNRVRLFVYDKNERVHSGSYRTNGVLVMVHVFMKAVIVTIPKPRVPVDCLEQEDSFEMAFEFYHPATSTSQRCVLYGRTQLREVVGPDKASLIASATIHELLAHIIEARTSVHFDRVETTTHIETKQIVLTFLRDRLYAKHKATPLHRMLEADAAANATKLIDAQRDRGLKLLTKTKTVLDDRVSGGGGSKLIVTVFDVGHTRQSNLLLRVDAYVCASSTRLSLTLEAPDLVHILDEEMIRQLNRLNESEEEGIRLKQRLAQRVIDHIAVERKRDGAPDRLFLVETSTAIMEILKANETKSRRLVGKTVRQIRHIPVVVTVYSVGDEGFEVQCYEPQTSARAAFVIRPTLVGLSVEDAGSSNLLDSVLSNSSIAASLVKHILSVVHIDMDTASENPVLHLTITTTDQEEQSSHSQRQMPSLAQLMDGGVTKVWRGLVAAVSAGQELCLVHVGLQSATGNHPDDSNTVNLSTTRLVCSVQALGKALVTTRAILGAEIDSLDSQNAWSVDGLLQACAARLCLRVLQPHEAMHNSGAQASGGPQQVVIDLTKS